MRKDLMQKPAYAKRPVKARVTFYAIQGTRRIRIQGTMDDVLARLRALCPGGTLRDLWEGKTC